MLERFTYKFYGDFKCSKCNKNILIGYCNCVKEEEDDEGYEWRSFCNDCWEQIKNESNDCIYSSYEPCDLVESWWRK